MSTSPSAASTTTGSATSSGALSAPATSGATGATAVSSTSGATGATAVSSTTGSTPATVAAAPATSLTTFAATTTSFATATVALTSSTVSATSFASPALAVTATTISAPLAPRVRGSVSCRITRSGTCGRSCRFGIDRLSRDVKNHPHRDRAELPAQRKFEKWRHLLIIGPFIEPLTLLLPPKPPRRDRNPGHERQPVAPVFVGLKEIIRARTKNHPTVAFLIRTKISPTDREIKQRLSSLAGQRRPQGNDRLFTAAHFFTKSKCGRAVPDDEFIES